MRQVAIPEAVYTGTSDQLFDFMAKELKGFIEEQEAAQQQQVRRISTICYVLVPSLKCHSNEP